LDLDRRHRARFGGLELLGSSLAPNELDPGQRLAVTLAWQAREAPLPDARFSLRLVDPDGQTRQEMTIHPATNIYPTGRWQTGDRFLGRFWLRAPEDAPPGRYRVEPEPVSPPTQANPRTPPAGDTTRPAG